MFVCNNVVLEFSDKSNIIIQRDMCSGVYILFQINLIFSTISLKRNDNDVFTYRSDCRLI